MTLEELKPLIKNGKTGLIPKWQGYIKWDYVLNQIQFVNKDYKLNQQELEDMIKNRNDLFYII